MTLRIIDPNKMSNAELDRVAVSAELQCKLKFRYRLLRDLSSDAPVKPWIVKGIIARGENERMDCSAWRHEIGSTLRARLCRCLWL
jgi:hypothetical protein